MNSLVIKNVQLNLHVVLTDAKYDNIISIETPTLECTTVKIANISVEDRDYPIYAPSADLTPYIKKSEFPDYFRVVDEEPSPEEQAANPNVMWFIRLKDTDLGPLCFSDIAGGSTVSLKCYELDEDDNLTEVPIKVSLEYSMDNKSTWQTWDGSELVIDKTSLISRIYIKAKNENLPFCQNVYRQNIGLRYFHRFLLTGGIEASGNIQYLLDPTGKSTYVEDEGFARLFSLFGNTTPENWIALRKAPDLPATSLYDNCYREMFSNCWNLSAAPAISANKLPAGCCAFMCDQWRFFY